MAREADTDGRRLVLVVDDDPETRDIVQMLLARAGYACAMAASGEEAVSQLEQLTPDLIVLDLSMPGMDGWSVAALVRKHERTARIPILVMTGLNANIETAARRAGATGFCLKPLEPKRFVKEVKRLCPLPTAEGAAEPVPQRGAGRDG